MGWGDEVQAAQRLEPGSRRHVVWWWRQQGAATLAHCRLGTKGVHGPHGPAKAEWASGYWAWKNEKWIRGRTGLQKETSQNQEGCRINLFKF
jgi:hypothetical protein